MNTGNTYICKKPYAVGEEHTDPATDTEHWELYLPRGEKGERGEQGPQGEKGEKGDKGEQGIQGAQGIQGIKGDKGDVGPRGHSVWLSNAVFTAAVASVPLSSITNRQGEEIPQPGDLVISTHADSNGSRAYFIENGNGGAFDGDAGWALISGSLEGPKGDKGDKGDKAAYKLKYIGFSGYTGSGSLVTVGYYAQLDEGDIPLYVSNEGMATINKESKSCRIPPIMPIEEENKVMSFIGYDLQSKEHLIINYHLYLNAAENKVMFYTGVAMSTISTTQDLKAVVLSPI